MESEYITYLNSRIKQIIRSRKKQLSFYVVTTEKKKVCQILLILQNNF